MKYHALHHRFPTGAVLSMAAVFFLGACRMSADRTADNLEQVLHVLNGAYAAEGAAQRDAAHWRQAASRLDEIAAGLSAEFHWSLRYHQARMTALAGDKTRAVQMLNPLIDLDPPLPEAVWLKIQLTHVEGDDESNRRRWQLEATLGEVLPISSWGRLRDGAAESREAIRLSLPMQDNPDIPTIPIVDGAKLMRIARLYDEMNFHDEAAGAYREAIYGGFAPPDFPDAGSETWISEEAAEAWLSAARCEAAAGRTRWAVHALVMSVVPSAAHELRAKKLLQSIFDADRVDSERKPDAQRLLEIASLYRDGNLHPRGLAPLAEAAKLPKADVVDRRNTLERDWLDLIQDYMAGREQTCFLFGQRVAAVSDKLDLSPRPFPYAGIR
jgi:tetratricopeptide (TPR) repeat protein